MTNKELLKIEHLDYRKNRRVILHEVNLSIGTGHIIALLGENGAGKTTLMRIISGVAKNYHGTVCLAGHEEEEKRKTHLAMTDPLKGFLKSSQLNDIVVFYKKVYSDFDSERFEELKDFMSIDLSMKLSQLSKGMREKLIVALTFSRQCDLYLLDEPFNGIDAMTRKKIVNSILRWKSDDSTIIISDHFVTEVAAILDDVIIIKDRTVFTHVSADEILKKHQSIESYYESLYEGEE